MSMNRTDSLTMVLALATLLAACERKPPPSPPAPRVAVIKPIATPTMFTEEYVGQ